MILIKLTSDNFESTLLTTEAYEAVVLTMSTGDYSTHKAEPVVLPSTDDRVFEAENLSADILIDLND